MSLQGHEDWVRGVAWASLGECCISITTKPAHPKNMFTNWYNLYFLCEIFVLKNSVCVEELVTLTSKSQ